MLPIETPCSGSFTPSQKRLFSGFPLSTMTLQHCPICGFASYPEWIGADWVFEAHCLPKSPLSADTLTSLAPTS
jgi:hypothetical protein